MSLLRPRKLILLSGLAGAVFVLVVRLVQPEKAGFLSKWLEVVLLVIPMVVMPATLGYLTVMLTEPVESGELLPDELPWRRRLLRIFVPCLASVAFDLGCFVGYMPFPLEGLLFVVGQLPILFLISAAGGLAAVFSRRIQAWSTRSL